MKTLLAYLALAATAMAQSGDDQRDVGRSVTPSELSSLIQKLTAHELKAGNLQDLLRRVDQAKKDAEQSGNPEKALALLEELRGQVPKEVYDAAMKKALSPEASPRESSPTPLEPRPADPVAPPPQDPSRREPARPDRRPTPPPNLQNNPAVRNLIRLWEKNMGPLEKTPALKKAFAELLQSGVTNGNGSSPLLNDDRLNSLIDPDSVFGKEIADWLDQAANGSSWKWSDLGLGDWNLSLPETGLSGGSGLGFAATSGGSSGSMSLLTSLLALAALGVLVAVLRRYGLIGKLTPTGPQMPPRVRFDPGEVQDRASLVAAFEHCSLDALGDDAKVWNHRAIAEELTRQLAVSDEIAAEASRLYELARYSPPHEALTPESYSQARRCLTLLSEAAPR